MKAYRLSTNLKAGLVVFAVLIAVASLAYTNELVNRLRAREQFIVEIWARAQEELGRTQQVNPYQDQFRSLVRITRQNQAVPESNRLAFLQALEWAQTMPPPAEAALAGEIVTQGDFEIPAIVSDSATGTPLMWRYTGSENPATPQDSIRFFADLRSRIQDMAGTYPPIRIVQDFDTTRLVQYVYYDESRVIRELRWFPYIQLLFVSLFVLVGYLGFSYVRRSEQRSLWVGMAKEAAHQLGTPISSLMGWLELLRLREHRDPETGEALDEIDQDIARLRRVAARFSDIGSVPRLDVQPLAGPIASIAAYIRRRIPQQGRRVDLQVHVPADIMVPLNVELFEWVIENLLKNALDAIEMEGTIAVTAHRTDTQAIVEVRDTGRGIDRRHQKLLFKPGFSTKKRGWGLGLSLAKRIVEDYHGGSLILASSRAGQGTVFRIALPLGSIRKP